MTQREKVLFEKMIEAGRVANVAEIEHLIAKRDYESAVGAYRLELQYQKEKEQEFLNNIEALETFQERVMYILDNQDELLKLFYTDEEIEKYKGVNTDAC